MRKLVITASIALASITAPVTTFAISEFVNDTTVAQPVQNNEFNRTQLVDRYVLPDYSNVSYSNLFNSVIRDIGSNNQKQINIIWRDATAKKAAMKIRTKLIKNGIASKSIYLEKKAHKAKTYPIYIEVAQIAPKPAPCAYRTGEVVFWNSNETSCALKSNQRVQLKY
ncbi:RcpB protein [Aggregatibacter actinomycetemcomitans]|uniref:RcpB protein n=1 Tax=Aggregatibacter actinomycetemcomitans TaxID=714 RepID=UPI00197B6185|nr:RcpB protein [Aggregatibacter actinomycetemcomitans]MBN6069401.1 RcpB protein [Aggregatibacter actinomycetemcomitans]MBN6085185.1 RcpB protein [Aggregatibacter actinomycetemcomitans]